MRMLIFTKKGSCERTILQLDRYSQGDLASHVMRDIEIHVSSCGACRKELEIMDQVVSLVEGLERPAPPPDLWQRVAAEIGQPQGATATVTIHRKAPLVVSYAQRWRWPGAMIATAAAAAIAAGIMHPQPTTHQVQPGPTIMAATPVRATPFVDQAQEGSFFDPLADRASLGAVVEAADWDSGASAPSQSLPAQLENVSSVGSR